MSSSKFIESFSTLIFVSKRTSSACCCIYWLVILSIDYLSVLDFYCPNRLKFKFLFFSLLFIIYLNFSNWESGLYCILSLGVLYLSIFERMAASCWVISISLIIGNIALFYSTIISIVLDRGNYIWFNCFPSSLFIFGLASAEVSWEFI